MQKGINYCRIRMHFAVSFLLYFLCSPFFPPVLLRENSQTEVSIAPRCVFVVSSRLERAFYLSLQLLRCTDKTDRKPPKTRPLLRTLNCKTTFSALSVDSSCHYSVYQLSGTKWPQCIRGEASDQFYQLKDVRAGVRTLYQKSLPHIFLFFLGGPGSLFFFRLTLHF